MTAAFSFVVPSAIPQDLQLIKDIIGEIPVPSTSRLPEAPAHSDHEHGTDSETDSEKEIEADILADAGGDSDVPSESTSDSDSSSSSDSESEAADNLVKPKASQKRPEVDLDEDEDVEVAATTDAQVRTKNEMVDVDVVVPEVEEVDAHEQLEEVGEVVSIVDRTVIVKGVPSGIANRGSEKALDSDTLLVFEDRKVLGYIFETFGPTSEPLYQVRFNKTYPLDSEKIRIGRLVFHVPARSRYVFVQQLRHLKGSDASNVHDEEPGDDELEFSDDEQEAAHKRAQAQRREQSRGRSVMSSRHSTPLPSRMRDQEMSEDPYGGGSYEGGPSYNDMDLTAPSRPAPIPYDDPYSDAFEVSPPSVIKDGEDDPGSPILSPSSSRGYPRGRGRGGRDYPLPREDSGRGRGRGRRQNDHGRGRGRGRGSDHRSSSSGPWASRQGQPYDYRQQPPRPSSPTSIAIARATGQDPDATPYGQHMGGGGSGWGYQHNMLQAFDFSSPYQNSPIQPHINPRFAANFAMGGMQMGYMGYGAQPGPYSQDTSGYNVGGDGSDNWNNGWGVQQGGYSNGQ